MNEMIILVSGLFFMYYIDIKYVLMIMVFVYILNDYTNIKTKFMKTINVDKQEATEYNSIVEDIGAQLNSSPTKKTDAQKQVPTPTLPSNNVPLTKDSILNDILNETAAAGDWKKMNEEPETKSVAENTQNLPDHLADAFTKDYSEVMKKVDEKAKFKNGA